MEILNYEILYKPFHPIMSFFSLKILNSLNFSLHYAIDLNSIQLICLNDILNVGPFAM